MFKIRLIVGTVTTLLGSLSFLVSITLIGCDGMGAGTAEDPTLVESIADARLPSEADIEFARVVPQVNKSGESRSLLMMGLQKTSRWNNRLGGLRVLSRNKDGRPVIIRDDGKNGDAQALDGIYSGFVEAGCLPRDRTSVAGKRIDFECTVLFVGPGHDCGEFGQCPLSVRRSLFWGLIEYETDIVFCVCLSECTGSK